MKRLLTACALGSLLFAGVAQAKVLVVAEVDATSVDYSAISATPNARRNARALRAVKTILDRYGADYKVVDGSQVNTLMCRIGVLNRVRKDVAPYRYDSLATPERFDAVIHVGFNGTAASFYAGYRPDSLTLVGTAGAQMPSVPQLMLFNEDATLLATPFDNGTADSTWISASGFFSPGAGGGNHEGEGTVFSTDNPALRFFDTIYGFTALKKSGSPSGGIRVLLSIVANATFTNTELTLNMPTDPDSASYANTDTMKVWAKLNEYGSQNGADVVFATCFGSEASDSLSPGGLLSRADILAVNWPVLLFAMAHLDSLAGGEVLGSKKSIGWGVGIVGAGTTSDRRHPGGFFLADSSIVGASMDSVRTTGAKVVVFADPESLSVRPWQRAIFNRAGSVRWAPWVRTGMDTLALPASGATSFTSPVDVWGRYRNRFIYGDASVGSSMGADSSIRSQLINARRLLAAQVGGGKLSTALLAPGFDWSPYNMRAHQNSHLLDSLLLMSKDLGGPLISFVQGYDIDPTYLRTNPIGWQLREGRYKTALAGSVNILGSNVMTIRGSRVGSRTDGGSFLSLTAPDTTAPICDQVCAGMNAAVQQEAAFWYGLFGPGTHWLSDGAGGDDIGVYKDSREILYPYGRASILLLPAQTFGGQDASAPNRWGYFVVKHLMNATKAINAKAGRTIIANQFPEEIEP